tara:strand:+ start:43 stop:633 length:591 start_codon:yes stop_codon:yes gene_type:complete
MENDDHVTFSAADALAASRTHRERQQTQLNRHLHACKLRLKRFITANPDKTWIVYKVPLVVIGSALKEAKTIINSIIHSLRSDGFSVDYLGSNIIFISWKSARHERKRDYVNEAILGDHAHRSASRLLSASRHAAAAAATAPATGAAGHQVMALTAQNLNRLQLPPPLVVSDVDRTRNRLNREIEKRIQMYANRAA